jgi:hypothetical protein
MLANRCRVRLKFIKSCGRRQVNRIREVTFGAAIALAAVAIPAGASYAGPIRPVPNPADPTVQVKVGSATAVNIETAPIDDMGFSFDSDPFRIGADVITNVSGQAIS